MKRPCHEKWRTQVGHFHGLCHQLILFLLLLLLVADGDVFHVDGVAASVLKPTPSFVTAPVSLACFYCPVDSNIKWPIIHRHGTPSMTRHGIWKMFQCSQRRRWWWNGAKEERQNKEKIIIIIFFLNGYLRHWIAPLTSFWMLHMKRNRSDPLSIRFQSAFDPLSSPFQPWLRPRPAPPDHWLYGRRFADLIYDFLGDGHDFHSVVDWPLDQSPAHSAMLLPSFF